MSIVWANWKTAFVRERGSLFFTVLAVLAAVGEFIAWARGSFDARAWAAIGFFLLMGPAFAILRLQRAILAQSLLFCLLGYRESLRVLTFSGAIVSGVAWSLFWTAFRLPATSAELGLNLAGDFLMGTVFYLALTTPRLILSRRAFALFRLAAIPFVFVVLTVEVDARDAPLVIWPIFMPVLVALCVFVWIRLGDMQCVQRGRRIILEEAIAQGPAPGPPRTTLPWVEKRLYSLMERQSYLQSGRYVRGQLYATLTRLLHYWKWILGSLIGVAWLLGYLGSSAANTVFVASGSLAWMQRWPLTSPLLLPGGREERYHATIGAVVAISLLLIAAALAVAALSWLLTLFLGHTPGEVPGPWYARLRVSCVSWACLLVPWFSALGLIGYKRPALAELCTILLVFMLVPFFCVLAIPIWPASTLRAMVAGVFVGGWLFLLALLRFVSTHWDLVGQQLGRDD